MLINDNQQSTKEYFLTIDGQEIPVTEEVYRAYKRPVWTERKRKEREKRCRDEKGNRCTKDCSKCDRDRTGSVLSLDKFIEDGFEVTDSIDVAELIADKLLFEELATALNELDPKNRRIAELYGEGLSEREIAAKVGLSQKGVNKRKPKIFDQLRQQLKDFQ
ncbi:sigma-70 family RNA polymerase sigma factor [Heliorestis acidaminivorans]|uniref:Sigma-70 family RNA polymerase sigma factor n=1 Tax=Heliorestis acidaminivorans TaxID=553427 RepID=A0A6I0EU83_9FIRM|nr:sigma factor-like helix-turn-helix DNA-binding protein [Heliorestis acidaminivorans]KAB2953744.1 sigma-70 family RNA polymerase sigma factor [Heliorestis acidaminivorans]